MVFIFLTITYQVKVSCSQLALTIFQSTPATWPCADSHEEGR